MRLLMDLMLLFASSFLAATLLPAQSEGILIWQLVQAIHPPWILLLCATVGNVAGSCVNWWLGKWAVRFEHKKWFPVTPEQMEKAKTRFNRYGRWSLLFAWVPIIGDPLTAAAGLLQVPLRVFLPLVTLGKAGRYAALWAAYMAFK